MKTTRKHIESLVSTINTMTGSPASYMTDGSNKSNVGHFYANHNSIYGGYMLERVVNESGGVTCPLGYSRHSASDFADILRAFITGLDFKRSEATR